VPDREPVIVRKLINNAGIGTEGLLANMRNSEIEALIRLNVRPPIVLTKYVVRHMMAGASSTSPPSSPRPATTACPSTPRQGRSRRRHPFAGPGSQQARHHRERDRARLRRRRTDSLDDDRLRRLPEADAVASMVEYFLGEGGRHRSDCGPGNIA
jgi:3-oxoacyl-[acyl-carrier protein] reductase